MSDELRYPRLSVLRFGQPLKAFDDVDKIAQDLRTLNDDKLWWVVLEHSADHNMSFEADEGRLTADENRFFYQATRNDLTFPDVREVLLKFLVSDPTWRDALTWERTPYESYGL